jgi:hypothetical protein
MKWHDIGGDTPPVQRVQDFINELVPTKFNEFEARKVHGIGLIIVHFEWENMVASAKSFMILPLPK